jgi:DNA-directed RNA polymerase specialized sigma subunit
MSAEFLRFVNSIEDPLQKDVVMLYYYHAKSNIAISEQLNYSETHIKRAKHKAVFGEEGK